MRFFAAYTSHSADTRAIPVFIALCVEKKKQQHKNDNFAAGTSTPSSRCTLLFYNKFFEVGLDKVPGVLSFVGGSVAILGIFIIGLGSSRKEREVRLKST